MGVVNPHTVKELIINKWLDGITTDIIIRRVCKKIRGTLTIKLVTNDYKNILPIGTYDSINSAGEVTTIPWLQWLLLDGNVTIVNYKFGTQPQDVIDRYSRTKKGLMFKRLGGRWTMPPQFAGTVNDNFLTRAVSSVRTQIQQEIEQEFTKAFKP